MTPPDDIAQEPHERIDRQLGCLVDAMRRAFEDDPDRPVIGRPDETAKEVKA